MEHSRYNGWQAYAAPRWTPERHTADGAWARESEFLPGISLCLPAHYRVSLYQIILVYRLNVIQPNRKVVGETPKSTIQYHAEDIHIFRMARKHYHEIFPSSLRNALVV